MKLLITGTAGFIGYHLSKRLSQENHEIICIDNINDYYDTDLKYNRLAALGLNPEQLNAINPDILAESALFGNIRFGKIDICDTNRITKLFSENSFDCVLHLAAQAGVRYSITNPHAYISSNIHGFLNILEAAKLFPPRRLIYASSSSVYGMNTNIPFSENDTVGKPVSLYAATKLSNELMAHTYNHLYHLPLTGLRFFTVYGPWGRPDMAPIIFAKSIMENKPINVYNNGNMKRDFTFIDDIVEGIVRIMNNFSGKISEQNIPAAIYNIGNGSPVELMDFIHTLENSIGKKAIINYVPMQPGDVIATWADCSKLDHDIGFHPHTDLSVGVNEFIKWYKEYYR